MAMLCVWQMLNLNITDNVNGGILKWPDLIKRFQSKL